VPPATESLLDGKPYLPRNAQNPISTAESLRDDLYNRLAACLRELGVEALLAKSAPFSAVVSTSVEIWRRVESRDSVTGRGSAIIKIEPKPFHRFPHELWLEYDAYGRTGKIGPLQSIPDEALSLLVRYLNGTLPRVRLRLPKLRTTSWHFWWPRNKITAVRRDPLQWISYGFLSLGALAAMIGWQLMATRGELALLPAALLALGGALGLGYRFFEPRVVLSTGKPSQEPRELLRLDSWQAVLRGIGTHESEVLANLTREFERSRPAEATSGLEDIWYWGVDGKEERRQIVITFRRALGFVHVYAYHNDLYVGWDVHVNGGTWSEVRVADGIDRVTGLRAVAHGIAAGWHVPNEYDITDANYLTEWIHALVVERVKEAMEEHKITQEVDFHILREERRPVVGVDKSKKSRRSLIKRIA